MMRGLSGEAGAKLDRPWMSASREMHTERLDAWRMLTLIASAIMNAAWATALYRIITFDQVPRALLPVLVYFTLLPLLTVLLLVSTESLRLKSAVQRAAGLAALVIALLLAFPVLLYRGESIGIGALVMRFFSAFTDLEFAVRPETTTLVLVLIFWRRGLVLAEHWVGPIVLQRELRIGILVLLAMGFAAAALNRPLPYSEVFLFLLAALMAMGAARISALSHSRGGRLLPFDRQWFLAVLAAALGLIVFASLFAHISGRPLASIVGWMMLFLATTLGALVFFLLRPVLVLLFAFITRLLSNLQALLDQEILEPETLPSTSEFSQIMAELTEEVAPVPFAGDLLEILRITLIVLASVAVALLVARSLRRTRAGQIWRQLEQEEREALLGSVPDYLRSLLQGLRRTPDLLNRLNPAARALAAARIRQIYRRLLRLSARLGVERRDAVTPLELLTELPLVFPDSVDELGQITRSYLRVRYGEYPETRKEVERVESAWRHVRKHGQAFPGER